MSVRDEPVSNRYLDLKEKEKAYCKHMSALSRARPTINTTCPEPARRIQAARRRTKQYRDNLIRNLKAHEVMVEEASPHRVKTKPSARIDWNSLAGPQPSARNKFDDLDLFRGNYRQYQGEAQSSLRYRRPADGSDDSDIPEPSDVTSTASAQGDTPRRQGQARAGQNGKGAKQQQPSSRPASSREPAGRPASRSKPYKGPTTKKIPPVNDVIRIGYSRDEKRPNETVALLSDDELSSTTSVIDPTDVSDEPSGQSAGKGKPSAHSSDHASVTSVKSGKASSGKPGSTHADSGKHDSSAKPEAKKPETKDDGSVKSQSSSKPDAQKLDTKDDDSVKAESSSKPDPKIPETKDSDSEKMGSSAHQEAGDMGSVKFESSGKPERPKPEPEHSDSDRPDSIKSEGDDRQSSDAGSVGNENADSGEGTMGPDDFEQSGNVVLPITSLGDSLIASVKDEAQDQEEVTLSDSVIGSPEKPAADDDAFNDDFD
jgi:hypothetical protein